MGRRHKLHKRFQQSHGLSATSVIKNAEDARRQQTQTSLSPACCTFMSSICPEGYKFDKDLANIEGWHGSDAKFLWVTPDDANELYNKHNYKHNRSLREEWALDLAEQVNEVLDIAIAIGPSNFPVVVNGQHNLWAIVLKDQKIRAKFSVYQCRDEQAIAQLYAAFDSNKIRSKSHIISTQCSAGNIKSEISANKLNRWAGWAIIASNEWRRPRTANSTSAILNAIKDPKIYAFCEFMESITSTISQKIVSLLTTRGVGASFYAMYTSDKPNAERFIKQYYAGTNLTEFSPVHHLRERMSSRSRVENMDAKIPEHIGLAFAAWRKFIPGDDVRLLKPITLSSIPKFDRWLFASQSAPDVIDTSQSIRSNQSVVA